MSVRRSYKDAAQHEILEKADELLEHSLRSKYGAEADLALEEFSISPTNKGKLGNLVEILHFGLMPNPEPRPDFEKSGIELKTTGMIKRSGGMFAKERLSLGSINYDKYKNPANRDFEKSGILEKCSKLLLMFYLYERNTEILDLVFKLAELWELPDSDKEIIRQDFEKIITTICSGKADELSEGATFYLGASTTGAGHGAIVTQPFNKEVGAKPRRFSFRKPYLDHILAVQSDRRKKKYGRIFDSSKLQKYKKKSIEEIVIEKFRPYYGMEISEIAQMLEIQLNPSSKSFAATFTKAVLKIELKESIEEFEKAGIVSRTVRLEPNAPSRESVSFPSFEFSELIDEEWETSDFKQILDSKFLFVFLTHNTPWKKGIGKRKLFLTKVKFWNMPNRDKEIASRVWSTTIELLNQGKILKRKRDGKKELTYFPGASENAVSHVRPHGKNAADTSRLPVPDRLTGATEITKQSFWFNRQYVFNEIFPS